MGKEPESAYHQIPPLVTRRIPNAKHTGYIYVEGLDFRIPLESVSPPTKDQVDALLDIISSTKPLKGHRRILR